MNETKIIFQAKNFEGETVGERRFNVAYNTFEGVEHFLRAEMIQTRKLGRKRFPFDFFVDYVYTSIAEGEEPNVYLD